MFFIVPYALPAAKTAHPCIPEEGWELAWLAKQSETAQISFSSNGMKLSS